MHESTSVALRHYPPVQSRWESNTDGLWSDRTYDLLQYKVELLLKLPLKVFLNTLIGPIRRSQKYEAIQYVFGDVFTDDRNILTILVLVFDAPIGAIVGLQPNSLLCCRIKSYQFTQDEGFDGVQIGIPHHRLLTLNLNTYFVPDVLEGRVITRLHSVSHLCQRANHLSRKSLAFTPC
ncbi:hypothetical protein NSND_61667 [Nitrospira sp. ND1]|nr:hypothetical protein NSND_61667 [Nitrospira sp. ND1]